MKQRVLPPVVVQLFPVGTYIAAYLATVAFAATMYLVPGGDGYLLARSGEYASAAREDVGSALYLFLLYSPLILVPLAAAATLWATRNIKAPDIPPIRDIPINRMVLWLLAIAGASYCYYSLYRVGALDLSVFGQGDYAEKTARRMDLLHTLGYSFFAFAYGINILVPVLALLSYDTQGKKPRDLVLFALSYTATATIIILTYSKAPIVVYALLAIIALLIVRSRWYFFVVVLGLSALIFIATGYVISEPEPPAAETSQIKTRATSPQPKQQPGSAPHVTADAYTTAANVIEYIAGLGGAVPHRMGVTVAYVPVIFDDPGERCGIQGNTVRRVLHLPPPDCVLPRKLFEAIYPEASFVQGEQPAPSQLSAYAELGLWWSIATMLASGLFLGLLGRIGSFGSSPLYLAFTVAACSFGYYLTQVPIVASFTYPHGLVIFMAPVGLLFLASLISRSPQKTGTASHPRRDRSRHNRKSA